MEAVIDAAVPERLDSQPASMRFRRPTVKHPFGTNKGLDGPGPLPGHDPRKGQNRDESSTFSPITLKRVIASLGVAPLMEVMRAAR
jgi:hypothetical protein